MNSNDKFWIAFWIVVFSYLTVDSMWTSYQETKIAQIELETLKIKQDTCKEGK